LPEFSVAGRLCDRFFGKAIVYARQTVTVGCTDRWMEQGIRDVPLSGQRIEAGHPVCTVFAEGRGRQECFDGLLLQAAARYREIECEREKCRG
jgi:predicted ATP-grasp superfamily ATP-dependent carboligase